MSSSTATLKMLLLGEDVSAGKTLKGVGNDADRTSSKMDKLHKAGGIAGKALAGGLLLAGAAAIKMTRAAADDAAAQVQLATQLKNSAHATDGQVAATEDWISAQGKALGVADDELRPALARLVAVTHDVGKAQSLASLGMDIAAGTGKSLTSVTAALAKAQTGSLGGLSKLGVATKDAEGKTLSLKEVTQQMADTYSGQAAKAAETNAGKQKILSVQMGELGEQIGTNLLPLMAKLTALGIAMIGWIGHNTTTVGIFIGVLASLAAITWAVSAATKAYTAIATIARVATIAWKNAQFALNIVMATNPIGLAIAVIAALVIGMVIAYKKSETFRAIVDAAFRGIVAAGKMMWEALKIAFDKLRDGFAAVGKAGVWLWNNALQPAFHFIVSGIASILEMWAKMLRGLSHVPGFGWAKSAADAMAGAADKARALADGIQKIPSNKTATLHFNIVTTGRLPSGHSYVEPHAGIPGYAKGTRYHPGGAAIVGEEGPELLLLPRGSQVVPGMRSVAAAGGAGDDDLGTVTVVVKSESGEVLQTKLLKLKRTKGGRPLGLA